MNIPALVSEVKNGSPRAKFHWPVPARATWSLLLVLAVIAPLYLVWTWSGTVGEIGSDATDYLLMALHFSPYSTASPAVAQAAAASRFPPLYPLVLAWLGAAAQLHRAHLITTAFFLLALPAWFAWLRRQAVPAPQAALLLLAFAAAPGSWLAGLVIQSEYSYLLWSGLAILFLDAFETSRRNEALYAAAWCVAAAALTRTIGVALLAPLAWCAWRAPRGPAVLAVTGAVTPLLVWHLLHRAAHGYGTALGMYYGEHGLARLRSQSAADLAALARGFCESLVRPPRDPLVAGLLGIACAVAAAWRALRLRPDAVYLACYLLVLLVWPYPEVAQRLLWAVLPLLLSQPLLCAVSSDQPRHRATSALAAAAIAGAIIVLALPSISQAAERYRLAADSGLPDARTYEGWYAADPVHAAHRVLSQETITGALRQISGVVPADDCVIAARKDLVNYYAQRNSVFPPLNSVPDPEFMQALHATGCHYVFMYNAADGHFPVPLHPLQRLRQRFQVLSYVERHDAPPGAEKVICILVRLQ